jgi:oligopeptide/dipeptide ABC transporter ATP-binding protein
MSRSQAKERTAELLEMVGIPGARKRMGDYPHQFSGGMRQRVMIAMALACRPKLILADEVTTALDVTIQAQILELLGDIARETGTAFILITHDLGIVAGMTQRTHVMYAGRIVEKAVTRELFANPRMPYTWGLLRSIPRLDQDRHDQLSPIEGLPPDLISPPPGCRFAPRCPYRREICAEREPELLQITGSPPGHEARCWGVQDVPDGGWLRDVDWRTDLGDPEVVAQIRRTAALFAAEKGRDGVGDDAGEIPAGAIS